MIDWTIIAAAYIAAYQCVYLIPLSILVIGNRQHALGILGHDGAHRLVAKHRSLNDALTNALVFYPLGIAMSQYRSFHWMHHLNINNEHDPEVKLKATRPNPIVGPVTRSKVVRHAIMDLIGFGIPHVLAFWWMIRPRQFGELGPVITLGLATVALTASGWYLIPALWFVSMFTSFWCFFRIRVWFEHVGLCEGETHRWDKPSLLSRLIFMPHNTWLHDVHHSHPGIPFNQLTGCEA